MAALHPYRGRGGAGRESSLCRSATCIRTIVSCLSASCIGKLLHVLTQHCMVPLASLSPGIVAFHTHGVVAFHTHGIVAFHTYGIVAFHTHGMVAFHTHVIVAFHTHGMVAFHTHGIVAFQTHGIVAFHTHGIVAFHTHGMVAFHTHSIVAFHTHSIVAFHTHSIVAFHTHGMVAFHTHGMVAFHTHGLQAVLRGLGGHTRIPTGAHTAPLPVQWPPSSPPPSPLLGSPPLPLVKLLLSIDRREGADAAMDTVELAAKFPGDVVGIDLSGNPTVGAWATWAPALARARALGLRVTIHAAEVPSPAEADAMLAFGADRLGHCCCLSSAQADALLAAQTPVELCLTSNVLSRSAPGYAGHHFGELRGRGCRVVLCTDDSGLFGTTLSREYAIAQRAFGLSRRALRALALEALQYVFCSDSERAWLEHAARQLDNRLEVE
eukprot:355589-Chlamydomonas_euryale.AAC.8